MTKFFNNVGQKIKSSPMVIGMFLAFLLLVGIVVIEEWFPKVADAWDKHNDLVRSVWLTAGFFATWVNYYWRWRRRRFFWLFLCTLLVVHTLGVSYYVTRVHALVLSDWIALLFVECFVVFFFMEWLIRRYARKK